MIQIVSLFYLFQILDAITSIALNLQFLLFTKKPKASSVCMLCFCFSAYTNLFRYSFILNSHSSHYASQPHPPFQQCRTTKIPATWTATGYIFCINCTVYIVYLSKDGYDKAAQQFVDDYYGNGDYTSDDQSEGEEHTDSSQESESESDSESDK